MTHWLPWLLGGSTVALIVGAVALSIFAPAVLQIVVAFIKPAVEAVGRFLGDALDGIRNNVKEGAPYIARNPKAIFCVLAACAMTAAAVYFPAKQAAKKAVWKEAHRDYTLTRKAKRTRNLGVAEQTLKGLLP